MYVYEHFYLKHKLFQEKIILFLLSIISLSRFFDENEIFMNYLLIFTKEEIIQEKRHDYDS